MRYFVGCDLAKKSDYTALAIVTHSENYLQAVGRYDEHSTRLAKAYDKPLHYDHVDLRFLEEENERLAERIPPPTYEVVQAYRLELGTDYTEVKKHLRKVMASPTLRGRSQLCVDATGVGTPVVDDLRADGLAFRAVSITGPNAREHREEGGTGDNWLVPKRELVARAKMLLDTGRLKIAGDIPFASALVDELLGFEYYQTAAGNLVYGAWREGQHDDLVLAMCIALWDAHKGATGEPNPALATTTGARVDVKDLEGLDDWFFQEQRDERDIPLREPSGGSLHWSLAELAFARPRRERRDFPMRYHP